MPALRAWFGDGSLPSSSSNALPCLWLSCARRCLQAEACTTLPPSWLLPGMARWLPVSLELGRGTVDNRLTKPGLTGWSNWLAQVTAAPSIDYAMAAMILASASIGNPDYVPQNYQVFLLTVLLMLIHGCISSMPTKWLAMFNSYGSTFNIVSLCIVVILIPADTNRHVQDPTLPKFTPSSEVWGTIYAGTDFPSGVSILMSFVSVIWTMRWVCVSKAQQTRANPRTVAMTPLFIWPKSVLMPTLPHLEQSL